MSTMAETGNDSGRTSQMGKEAYNAARVWFKLLIVADSAGSGKLSLQIYLFIIIGTKLYRFYFIILSLVVIVKQVGIRVRHDASKNVSSAKLRIFWHRNHVLLPPRAPEEENNFSQFLV